MMTYMLNQMERQFRNQAIKELKQKTVKKFEDAQVGNYARVFLKLANRVKRKLVKRFSDDRLDRMSDKIINAVDDRSKKQFYAQLEKAVGISSVQLMRKEGLTPEMNALKLETLQWVKKLRDETLEEFTNNTLHAMTQGKTIEEILQDYDQLAEKRKNHAEFLARNQIQNYNATATKLRAQKAGVKRAVWSTSNDERVRPAHEARDGKEFDLSEGLYSSVDGKSLIPGVDYNCRCTSVLVLDDED